MSYYQPPSPQRRTALGISLGIVVLLILAVGAYVLGRGEGGARTSSGPASSTGSPAPVISWSIIGGQPVPVSSTDGPRSSVDGRAVGFSHNSLGAALAALNISVRLSSEVGQQIYEATARSQCFGDVDTTLEQIRDSTSTSSPGSTTPSEFWYKVTSGNPEGDLVLISIVAKTPEGAAGGGYVGFDRTMRWIDNDWQMQIPPPRPSIISSVNGFTLLGRPHV